MSARRQPFHIALCCALILAISGGPWLALQLLAWTRMAVTYSQADGIWRGLSKTFDGQHPCSLCKSVGRAANAERTAEESNPTRIAPADTLWAAVLPLEAEWITPTPGRTVALPSEHYPACWPAPLTPPPRV
jgi:hypothetical protein